MSIRIDPKQLLSLYEQGYTDEEVMAELKVKKRDFHTYMEASEDFRDLVEAGRDLAYAFWVSQPRKNLKNKDFMTPLFQFYMNNRYAWSTKAEVKNPEEIPSADKIKEYLRQKVPKLFNNGNVLNLDDVRKAITSE